MKQVLLSILAACIACLPAELKAQQTVAKQNPEASFTSVTGKVTVKRKNGNTITAKVGAKTFEGETVTVEKGGKATLQFFDGSSLDLKSNTRIVLTKLKQPSEKEKNLRFSLKFGDIFAKVKKLLTPSSSFEVEAGGVVCGVRGTQFEVSYDPKTNQTHVYVIDGKVITAYDGNATTLLGGQNAVFPPQQSNNNSPGEYIVLGDLNKQFGGGGTTNGDNNFTNPSVAGSTNVNIHAHVGGN